MKDDDFDKLSREVKFDAASKAIKKDPDNWSNSLEELGFTWIDDGYGDEEEAEEKTAKAETKRQILLTDYFNGFIVLSRIFLMHLSPRETQMNRTILLSENISSRVTTG